MPFQMRARQIHYLVWLMRKMIATRVYFHVRALATMENFHTFASIIRGYPLHFLQLEGAPRLTLAQLMSLRPVNDTRLHSLALAIWIDRSSFLVQKT